MSAAAVDLGPTARGRGSCQVANTDAARRTIGIPVIVRCLLLVIFVLLPACRGLDDPGASAGVFFPRHGQSGPHALALLEGRFEVQEGCLLVVHANGERYMPIWPGGFGLRRAPGALQITDATGRVVAV